MRFKFTTDKTPTAEQAAATVKRLEAKVPEAQAALADAEGAYGVAVLEAEEDPTPASLKAADAARKAVAAARAAVADAELAVSAARQRHAEIAATESAAQVAARWNEADELQKQSETDAAEAERLNGELVALLNKVIATRQKLWRTIPVKDPAGGATLAEVALLGDGALLAAWRVDMATRGKWAWLAPTILWGARPGFAERIRGAGEYLTRLRGKAV